MVVGALLWVGQAVNSQLLVALIAIGSQQAAATEGTMESVHQLLDYCATYPNNGILYKASSMVLAGHAYTCFNNKIKAQSRAGDHTLQSENNSIPRWNGALHILKTKHTTQLA